MSACMSGTRGSGVLSSTCDVLEIHRIHHRPLQPLSHDLSDSGDMEVFIDYPNTETWQGHLHRNFVLAYLASLSSGESTGVSDSAHYKHITPTYSKPTQF